MTEADAFRPGKDVDLMEVHRAATEAALDAPPAPRLVHSGTYALYETPDGGRRLAYRRVNELSDDGHLLEVPGAEDVVLPEIPPAAIPLIESFLANGLPPAVLAMLSGKLSPLAVMKALKNGAGE